MNIRNIWGRIIGKTPPLSELLAELTQEIELAGQLERQAQRILHGCCAKCGVKLPDNSPSYHCVPDCQTHLADRCEEEE